MNSYMKSSIPIYDFLSLQLHLTIKALSGCKGRHCVMLIKWPVVALLCVPMQSPLMCVVTCIWLYCCYSLLLISLVQ